MQQNGVVVETAVSGAAEKAKMGIARTVSHESEL